MIGHAEKRMVEVWGTQVEITLVHQSKTVWRAYGDYFGKQYEGKGATANAAIASWRETARYMNN